MKSGCIWVFLGSDLVRGENKDKFSIICEPDRLLFGLISTSVKQCGGFLHFLLQNIYLRLQGVDAGVSVDAIFEAAFEQIVRYFERIHITGFQNIELCEIQNLVNTLQHKYICAYSSARFVQININNVALDRIQGRRKIIISLEKVF